MKSMFLIGIIFLLGLIKAEEFSVTGQKKAPVDSLRLVWADEFNTPGTVNPLNWKFENGLVRNEEFQWYQTQNAHCKNGLLTLEAKRERKPNPNYVAGSSDWRKKQKFTKYTSSSINTSGLHSFKYGRFVMRAKIDTAAGLWPAFWTLGVHKEWPSNGEIDIMEYYRKNLLANIACGTSTPYKAEWHSTEKLISTFKNPKWASKFHIWRMDWTEKAISLYVDDQLLNAVPLGKLENKDGTHFNPFKQEHYILLNLAIGGQNGGNPTPTSFPRKYEIDYVRVYQK